MSHKKEIHAYTCIKSVIRDIIPLPKVLGNIVSEYTDECGYIHPFTFKKGVYLLLGEDSKEMVKKIKDNIAHTLVYNIKDNLSSLLDAINRLQHKHPDITLIFISQYSFKNMSIFDYVFIGDIELSEKIPYIIDVMPPSFLLFYQDIRDNYYLIKEKDKLMWCKK